MDNEMYDYLVVKNSSERIPVCTDMEGLRCMAEIHGASNILNLDGSPYLFPEVALTTVEVATEEAVLEDEDKPKRKSR